MGNVVGPLALVAPIAPVPEPFPETKDDQNFGSLL